MSDLKVNAYSYLFFSSNSFVSGVFIANIVKRQEYNKLLQNGFEILKARELVFPVLEKTKPNLIIIFGSLIFVIFTILMGTLKVPFSQEIVFLGSMLIIFLLLKKLSQELDYLSKNMLIGTAIIIFVFRAIPGVGQ